MLFIALILPIISSGASAGSFRRAFSHHGCACQTRVRYRTPILSFDSSDECAAPSPDATAKIFLPTPYSPQRRQTLVSLQEYTEVRISSIHSESEDAHPRTLVRPG